MTGHRARSQAGSATVLAVTLLGVLASVTAGLAVVGGLLVAQRRAEAAADLAALAGAGAVQRGGDGCGAAAATARENHAVLSDCRREGADVVVEVSRRVDTVLGRTLRLHARARAGPAARPGPATPSARRRTGTAARTFGASPRPP